MTRSLNEAYKNNEVFYYCNACGDINIPGTDPWSLHEPGELPLQARELYENCWTEGAGLTMYVVKYGDVTTIAVNALFDYGYMEDLSVEHGWENDERAFWEAVEHTAKLADLAYNFHLVTLCGKDTDPDGHEILFILRPEMCAEAAKIAADVGGRVYDDFEREYAFALRRAERTTKN